MERKQCSLCGKWVIIDKIVMTCHGKYYCSACYHEHKTIMEYPYEGKIVVEDGNCDGNAEFECWGCKKIDECVRIQIESKE